MKKIQIVFILFLINSMSFAQQIKKFSIDSGGASVTASGTQLLYTIGEVNVQELQAGSTAISEGFITPVVLATASIVSTAIVNFYIYPNPVTAHLNFVAENPISEIQIYNQLGQLVKAIKPNSLTTSMDLTDLSNGIYLVKTQIGDAVTDKKIIKTK